MSKISKILLATVAGVLVSGAGSAWAKGASRPRPHAGSGHLFETARKGKKTPKTPKQPKVPKEQDGQEIAKKRGTGKGK
jgi:hypothetical protein